jgi:magnesium-transporting ATPase (P-type)
MAAATAFPGKSKRAKGIFARRSTVRINYLAVIVAAILYFLLGGLWFGFLFSNQWVALEGFKEADLKNINPTIPYIVSMIANLVIAFILALVCATQKADSAVKGAQTGILMGIGFVATTALSTYMFEGRSFHLYLINEGYPVVGLGLMGGVIGAWKKKAA